MPSLVCSSRYTLDSQILRKAAQQLGWETLRLDGDKIPDWFEPPDDDIALFYTAPHSFNIAKQLNRKLVGCGSDWTVNLPPRFLQRELHQTTLASALDIENKQFVKHSLSKAFPAAIYDADSLAKATHSIHPDSIVHIGEPVRWSFEYRCFVANGDVMTISPYVYEGVVVKDYESFPVLTDADVSRVRSFANSVMQCPDIAVPPAFVLDVGIIQDRGWAVVECNECWASGIYACDPIRVLNTLVLGNIDSGELIEPAWDYETNYAIACPSPDSLG